MSPERKKHTALEAITHQKTITRLADENYTSRKFIRQQGNNLQGVIDKHFDLDKSNDNNVIYYIPITKAWITQFVIVLMLLGHVSYRNIIMIIKNLLDYDICLGSINNIFNAAVEKARQINAVENLSNIQVTANDELFHDNKPILSGIDVRSLYCYLLSSEDQRDEETWAIHLMYAEDKGLKPLRTIGDDAKGLVSGHKIVFPETPYDYDNFHLSRGLMDLRRYFRNRLKTAITELNTLEQQAIKFVDNGKFTALVSVAIDEKDRIQHISTTLDTLISWLEHDILNKAGPTPGERSELYYPGFPKPNHWIILQQFRLV